MSPGRPSNRGRYAGLTGGASCPSVTKTMDGRPRSAFASLSALWMPFATSLAPAHATRPSMPSSAEASSLKFAQTSIGAISSKVRNSVNTPQPTRLPQGSRSTAPRIAAFAAASRLAGFPSIA